MVSDGQSARKRIRDYSAERARRNAAARAQGFTSLDTRAKAIRSGIFPTAKARRTDPAERERAAAYTARVQREREARKAAAEPVNKAGDNKRDAASRKWSRTHSRQPGTQFHGNWPEERRDLFYRAFVQWWKIPHDERDFEPTYEYMTRYPDGFRPERDPDYGHAAN